MPVQQFLSLEDLEAGEGPPETNPPPQSHLVEVNGQVLGQEIRYANILIPHEMFVYESIDITAEEGVTEYPLDYLAKQVNITVPLYSSNTLRIQTETGTITVPSGYVGLGDISYIVDIPSTVSVFECNRFSYINTSNVGVNIAMSTMTYIDSSIGTENGVSAYPRSITLVICECADYWVIYKVYNNSGSSYNFTIQRYHENDVILNAWKTPQGIPFTQNTGIGFNSVINVTISLKNYNGDVFSDLYVDSSYIGQTSTLQSINHFTISKDYLDFEGLYMPEDS